jgi:hypothetical protein
VEYHFTRDAGLDIYVIPARGAELKPLINSAFDESQRYCRPMAASSPMHPANPEGMRFTYVPTQDKEHKSRSRHKAGEEPVWSRDGKELFFRQGALFLPSQSKRVPRSRRDTRRSFFPVITLLVRSSPIMMSPRTASAS